MSGQHLLASAMAHEVSIWLDLHSLPLPCLLLLKQLPAALLFTRVQQLLLLTLLLLLLLALLLALCLMQVPVEMLLALAQQLPLLLLLVAVILLLNCPGRGSRVLIIPPNMRR